MKKRYKINYLRLFILLFIVLSLLISIFLLGKELFKTKNNDQYQLNYFTKIKEVGEKTTKQDKNYTINYPKFNQKNIDDKIKEIVETRIKALNNFNSQDINLSIDYASYKNVLQLNSLVFISKYQDKDKIISYHIDTLNVNLNNDLILKFEDIFKAGAKTALMENVKTVTKLDQVKDIKDFIFVDNKFKVMINPKDYELTQKELIEVNFDLDNIKTYLNDLTKVIERIKNVNIPIDPNKPMVALSYDDGPSPQTTTRLLDYLKKENVRASFYVLGKLAKEYPDIVKRIYQEGHEVGNHSYSHASLPKLSGQALYDEIEGTNKIIKDILGVYPSSFRPPYGAFNNVADAINLPIILWSVDTLDWESRNASSIVQKIKNEVEDGDIILMHDIYESTLQASYEIIPWLKHQGYQIVSVQQLMQAKKIPYEKQKIYFSTNEIRPINQ